MPAMSKPLVEETEPKFERMEMEGCDTLLVHLPGYLKENLKVQVTTSGNLRVIGERKVSDGKSSRFQKEFRLSEDCDINGITAKFEGGVLKVKLPKMAGSTIKKEEAKQETKHTSTEDEKPRDKGDEHLAELDEKVASKAAAKEAEGHGEKHATEEKYKKMRLGKLRTKKATLLAVLILGVVGAALGLWMLQSKGRMTTKSFTKYVRNMGHF